MKFAQIAKRVGLFIVVNLFVMVTLSIIAGFIFRHFHFQGYYRLMVWCLVWGMGGAFISLLLSRQMAKWMMGVQVIDPNTSNAEAQQLVQTVHQLARAAGLSHMPEVGYYESPEVNAFATGPSQSRALVAVSTGLLRNMREGEVEGVLGHEITHIANGDMVTMTLIQGVVNAFAMFLAWALTIALSQSSRDDDDRPSIGGFGQYMMMQLFQTVFLLLGSIVVAAFSRWREFRADAGGARLAGRDNMIAGLRRLQIIHEQGADIIGPQKPAFQSLKISGKTSGLLALFATHPPIEQRIARLENPTLS